MSASADRAWPVTAPPAPAGTLTTPPPTMSVVVAAYQAAGTIARALDSALDQTAPPLEVVVCDDGSTDATADVLASYGERIRVVRQANGGEGAAKNTAVRAARGDWVVVLDADDEFDRRRLEAIGWAAARRPDLDVITTDAYLEVDGRRVRRAYCDQWSFAADNQRATILVRNFVLGLAAVRRSTWLAAGGFDERLTHTADWDFWQRLILTGARVGLVDAPLATYRLALGSLSADRERMVLARIGVLERAGRLDSLTADERASVTAAISEQRRLLALHRARAALRAGAPDVRARSLDVARCPGMPPRTRAKALVAVAAPRFAAARYRAVKGGRIEVGAGMWVDDG